MSVPSARKKRLAAAVGLALAAGLGYAAWVRATGLGVPCPFHMLTGLYCPGCGITRCISALLQGNWQAALRSNAAIVVLAPFFVWLGWAAQLFGLRQHTAGQAAERRRVCGHCGAGGVWRCAQFARLLVFAPACLTVK